MFTVLIPEKGTKKMGASNWYATATPKKTKHQSVELAAECLYGIEGQEACPVS